MRLGFPKRIRDSRIELLPPTCKIGVLTTKLISPYSYIALLLTLLSFGLPFPFSMKKEKVVKNTNIKGDYKSIARFTYLHD